MATSAHQIEGAVGADGRGESIWDRFASQPGAIEDGSSGAIACDHYHRFTEDVAIMADLGLSAYRFSIAWPRVLPQGTGPVNEAGLDFYQRLVDTLLEAGIRPFVTLYHWDLPQALQDRGGWPSRDTAEAFVEYAAVVARALGDRVTDWITHNEPWCVSILGHEQGVHAPGQKNTPEALAAAHHLLLSHGLAVPVIRQHVPDARVGLANIISPGHPASPSAADRAACRRFDGLFNRWYLDPLYGRGYPEDIVAFHRAEGNLPEGPIPFVHDGDFETMATPTDFLAVNYYSRTIIRDESIPDEENEPRTVERAPTSEDTDMGWEVYPDGLREVLVRVHREYQPPTIYVTEFGCAYGTGPDEDGRVRDHQRTAFLRAHLAAMGEAREAGVPVEGAFVWSLLDNFEWAFGYQMRFGLVWVDYETQRRVLKDSAHWLRETIRGEISSPGASQ